jgi:hypothetical protein
VATLKPFLPFWTVLSSPLNQALMTITHGSPHQILISYLHFSIYVTNDFEKAGGSIFFIGQFYKNKHHLVFSFSFHAESEQC